MNNESRAQIRSGLIEVLLVALVFTRPLTLSLAVTGLDSFALSGRYLENLLSLIPQTALLLLIIGKSGSLPSFFSPIPKLIDTATALAGALAVLMISLLTTYAMKALGVSPDTPRLPLKMDSAPFVFLPLVALSSLAVGAWEELIYRVYFVKKLEHSGVPQPVSIALSAALFAAGHAYQGIAGIIGSFFLALVFSLFYAKTRSWYAIAGAHAIYDFIAIMTLFAV